MNMTSLYPRRIAPRIAEVPSKSLRGPPSSVATGMGKNTAAATVAGGVGMASASRSDTKDEKSKTQLLLWVELKSRTFY